MALLSGRSAVKNYGKEFSFHVNRTAGGRFVHTAGCFLFEEEI
jgi:hypothetical protein